VRHDLEAALILSAPFAALASETASAPLTAYAPRRLELLGRLAAAPTAHVDQHGATWRATNFARRGLI